MVFRAYLNVVSKPFNYVFVWLLLICVFATCVEPYNPEVVQEDHSILVVDGFLVQNDSTIIKLSRTKPIGNSEKSTGERHAIVTIEAEDGTTYPLQEKLNGLYAAPALNVDPDQRYRVNIRTNDREEYRSAYVPLKRSPMLDSVIWHDDADLLAVSFSVYAHDPENKTHYYLWAIEETWKYVSINNSVYYFENGKIHLRENANEFYECWETLPVNNVFIHSTVALTNDIVYDIPLYSIPHNSRKLYFGYSALVKQYALTEEAFTYWTLTKKNSESLGGLFDPLPSQALSNLRCVTNPNKPVVGYFTATSVTTKRVFFTRQQITGPSGPYTPTGYELCEGEVILLDQLSEENLRGKMIHFSVHDRVTFELLGYDAYPIACMDCRVQGGVNVKPDYWR